MNKFIPRLIVHTSRFVCMLVFAASQALASASPTETVMELIEGSGEISSSSTGDKMEAWQMIAQVENHYAEPAAPLGSELARQVQLLMQQQPDLHQEQAIDLIYERAQQQ
jgi:hypothetical protein